MKRIPRFRSSLAKLRTLGPRDWLLLLKAQWALAAARREVARRPQGELVDSRGESASTTPDPARKIEAQRIAVAVRRASNYGLFHASCLVRSIAIDRLLRSSGIPGGQIRVGVALRGDRFVAHAWVEYGGVVIGDDDDVARRFATIEELKVVAGD